MVTLEWKDWRDELNIAYPLEKYEAQQKRPPRREPTIDPGERLGMAFEACQDLFFLGSATEALEFAVRLLDELLPTDVCVASAYDIDANSLRPLVATGVDLGAEHRTINPGVGLVAAATPEGSQAVRVNGLVEDGRFQPEQETPYGVPEVACALYVAIQHGGRLFGLLQLFMGANGRFSRADADLVTYIAKQLGEFMGQLEMRVARSIPPPAR